MLFLRTHRRLPRLRKPRTLSEKMNWRILYDRRPEIAWTCDKLESKRRVAAACPSIRIPQVHWSGTDLGQLAEVDLPENWVLKPNAGCGHVLKGRGRIGGEELPELFRLTEGWLDQDIPRQTGEWAYSRANRCFLVEDLVGSGSESPTEHKALVIDREVVAWSVVRSGQGRPRVSLFSPGWQRLDVQLAGYGPCGEVACPALIERMNEAAKAITGDLDLLRVDLYESSGELWFGETTLYPNSGLIRYVPEEVNLAWGDLWKLPGDPGEPEVAAR